MKSNFTAIALISIAAFAGSNSFAGSGNDEKTIVVDQPASRTQVTTMPAPVSDFDPQINIRVGNEYPFFSA